MKREYEKEAVVDYVELDYQLELFDAMRDPLIPHGGLRLVKGPDDPLFPQQWYLNNTGQGYLGINRIPGDHNDSLVVKYDYPLPKTSIDLSKIEL